MKYLVVEPDEALDPGLRADLLDTWIAATDAGGAVGFTAPAPVRADRRDTREALGRVAPGLDLLGVLHTGERYAGMGLLVERGSALQPHWRTVLRVMVHPQYQGNGAGRLLMEGLRGSAVDLGPRAASARRSATGSVWRRSTIRSATGSSAATRARSASPRTTTATRSCWCRTCCSPRDPRRASGVCAGRRSGGGSRWPGGSPAGSGQGSRVAAKAVMRVPRVTRIAGGPPVGGSSAWLTVRRSLAGWAPTVNLTGAVAPVARSARRSPWRCR